MASTDVDYVKAAEVARRLFEARQRHTWPAVLRPKSEWESLYGEAASGLSVLSTLDEAIAWANDLIRELDGRHPA